MSELFEKSIRVLELPRLLEMLEHHAVSAEAKARARRLTPSDDFGEVNRLLDETDAARKMIMLRGSPAFGGVRDVGEALSRAERGGMLNTRELLDIAGLLTNVRRVQDYYKEDEEGTVIDKLFLSLHPNRFLEEKITTAILDENEIADAASPELAEIRRHKRAAAAKGRQILQRIISSPSYRNVLQDALITQRGGRFVVPVKAECRGELPGLVHDTSSSGATIFVEPMGVVQANNELKELEAKEEKEIDRILYALSGEAASFSRDILWDYDILVHLDLIFARGELSYRMNAMRPELKKDGSVYLRHARHPLLDPAKAVPIDIELGRSFDTLVITGPNTGGKTVSLKTLGLLCLMTQCGLHIPCDDRSAVSIFSSVLADIGDEQSIEQSLSTFSAHMKNIVQILDEADEHCLILFDELGAGTDPVEGAALAIAVIEQARSQGAKIAATTHYAELKTFAMTTAGVENASCEFDVETLCPTYKLLIGIPGKSNAFAISKRLGLSEAVIEKAKAQMDSESIRFEDVLTQLEQKRQQLEKEKAEVDRLYAQRAEIMHNIKQARDAAGVRDESAEPIPKPSRPIEVGDLVEIPGTRRQAEVIAVKDGTLTLKAGVLQMKVKAGEVRLIEAAERAATAKKQPQFAPSQRILRTASAARELDIRGMETLEAESVLDNYIDAAVMAHLETVTIIHGKGTGALRKAVHASLRRNKAVKGFRLGNYGEGESGVTVVELK